MLSTMRKTRRIEHCRCYHLMSRLAHRAFFLDDEEKTRAVEILRRINARYREASLSQVLGRWKRLRDEEADLLKRARPTKKFASRFAECRSSFLRRIGIKSRIHFNRYCLAPMLEKGLVVRTVPQHPNAPHQEYERI